MSSKVNKKHLGILTTALILVVAVVIGTIAVFTDRVNQTVSFTVVSFSKDGYTLERKAPEGYFVASESVTTTITEKNKSTSSMNAELTMSAVWSSPDPSCKIWGNSDTTKDAVLLLDGNPITYTVLADDSISFTLPQVTIDASGSLNRELSLQIPASLISTGTLNFSFDEAVVSKPNTQWDATFTKEELNSREDLGFSVGVVWNISKDQSTKDVIAFLSDTSGSYGLEVVKNGKSGNTNDGKMMDFTITKAADTSINLDDASKWVSDAPWYYYRAQIGSVNLPDSLTTIGDGAFLNLTFWNGALTLPSTVTSIGEASFGNAKGLTSVIIPDSVKTMEAYAFTSCQNVETLILGSGLTELSEKVFFDNLSLANITWNTSQITTIGKSAFERAGQKNATLGTLSLPDSVKTVGERAFADTHGIQALNLSKVQTIAANAFEEALKLSDLTIPASVKTVGERAFYNCRSLIDITFAHGSDNPLTLPATDTQQGAFRLDDEAGFTPLKTSVYSTLTKVKAYGWLEDNRLLKGEPILKQYLEGSTEDFHAYKDTATKITVMDHYDPPATFTAGPWDVSAAGDESVMAYLSGTEIYICSNVYSWTDVTRNVNAKVIANEYSSYLFQGFSKVTEIQVTNLDTSNAVDMASMFAGCEVLTTLDVSGFVTDNVTDFSNMFAFCTVLDGLDVSSWKTGNALYMNGLFFGCSTLSSLDMSSWNTEKVVTIESMFSRASSLTTSCGMENWSMPKLTNIGMAFASSGFVDLDLSNWACEAMYDMYMAFTEAKNLQYLGLSGWRTADGATMQLMFRDCSSLETIDLTGFDPSGVKSMRSTFYNCTSLTDVIIDEWNAESCTNMYGMFQNCSALESFSTDNWFTENVTMTYRMFYDCSSMKTLDLSDFNSRKVTSADDMFNGMVLLDTVTLGSDFVFLKYGKLPTPSKTYIPGANGKWYNTSTWEKYTPTALVTAHSGLVTYTAYPPVLDSIEIVTPPDTVEYSAGTDFDPTGMEVQANYTHSDYPDHSRMLADDEYTIPDGSALTTGQAYVTVSYTEDGVTKTDTQPITVKLAIPMLNAQDYWYDTNVDQDLITSITLVDTYDLTGKTIVGQWDASDPSVSGTVTAYLEDDGLGAGTYKLTLAGNGYGKIYANPDSYNAFSYFGEMTALNGLVSSDGSAFLDTSKTTDMSCMFNYDSELLSLDVSKFDTSLVTDFSYMFQACSTLTTVDVSNFNTSNATTFEAMFAYCNDLVTVDVSSWNTANVQKLNRMFDQCYDLKSLNVSDWNVSKVTDTGSMFQQCGKLSTLDVTNWVFTTALTDTGYMFSGCESLPTIVVDDWVMDNVTDMTAMFQSCMLVTTLDVSNWNTGSVVYMSNMFNSCQNLSVLDVSQWNVSNAVWAEQMFFECKSLTSLAVDNWNVSKIKNMAAMFYHCENLATLNVSNWKTEALRTVTNIMGETRSDGSYKYDRGMFEACKKLAVIDISDWNMSQIKNNARMFADCTSLKQLTVPASAAYISPEFAYNCTSMTEITFNHAAGATVYLPDAGVKTMDKYPEANVDENGVYSDGGAFYVPSYLETTITTSNETIKAYDWVTDNRAKALPMLASSSTWYSQGGTTVDRTNISSITLADTYDTSGKTIVSQWDASDGKVGSVTAYVEDDGLGAGTFKLTLVGNGTGVIYANKNSGSAFSFGAGLTAINNLTLLDTSKATTMAWMFEENENLASLDLSAFNTEQVTNFQTMFSNCASLKTLDLSSFNTTQAKYMANMFEGCKELTSINLSTFVTDNVKTMSRMFYDCNSLQSLDLSHFRTSNVGSLYGMFQECKSLTYLNISNFDTSNVDSLQFTFQGCESLPSLSVASFDTSSVESMRGTFMGCEKLTSLDVSHFNTENVNDMAWMFEFCYALTSLDVTNFVTDKVTDMNGMFHGCGKVPRLDLRNFNTSLVTDMSSMFSLCWYLTDLDISSFNTSLVDNMSFMFQACSSLQSLDLSHFNTDNVTSMTYMFSSCTELASLNLSSFNTEKVESMYCMFSTAEGLTSLDISNFQTPALTSISQMFYMDPEDSSLRTLDMSGFDFSNVTGVEKVFHECFDLTVYVADEKAKSFCESLTDVMDSVTFVVKGSAVSTASTLSLDFDAASGTIAGYTFSD